MRSLTRDDILTLDEYLPAREQMRTRVREARAARRVQVGDRISLSFENRETVLFQIEEMIRVEAIRDEAKIAEEIRVYNDLLGGTDELRATFFVEITDRARIKEDLDSLVGLESGGLWLDVQGERVAAEFEPGHAREDRISAVHFVSFRLTPALVGAFAPAAGGEVALVVEHPAYGARAALSGVTRAALLGDLESAPEPAADPDAPGTAGRVH